MDLTLKERLGKLYDKHFNASMGTFFGIDIEVLSKDDLRCVVGFLVSQNKCLMDDNQRERETWKAIYHSKC